MEQTPRIEVPLLVSTGRWFKMTAGEVTFDTTVLYIFVLVFFVLVFISVVTFRTRTSVQLPWHFGATDCGWGRAPGRAPGVPPLCRPSASTRPSARRGVS